MKQKQINRILISVIAVLVLLICLLTIGVTTAWFGTVRQISGNVQLTPGILVDFEDTIKFDENSNEFHLMKYDVNNLDSLNSSTTKSRLYLTNVRNHEKVYVVNPIMNSLTSDEFYIRAKIIYKNATTNEILEASVINEVFKTSTPILFNSSWLVDENNEWSYYVGDSVSNWENDVANANDLKVVNGNEVAFFKTESKDGVTYVELSFQEELEAPIINEIEIILQLQAVEIAKVNEQFFS